MGAEEKSFLQMHLSGLYCTVVQLGEKEQRVTEIEGEREAESI